MYSFLTKYISRGNAYEKYFVLRLYKRQTKEICLREYTALKTLKTQTVLVPEVFALEMDKSVLGAPFMIMEKIDGISASHLLKNGKDVVATVDMLASVLAAIHAVNPTVLFDKIDSENQFVFVKEKLSEIRNLINIQYITGFSPFTLKKYLNALKKLEKATIENSTQTLIHGDFGPDHVLLANKGPVVLDWEGVSLGDPAYDVAWTYHILMLEGVNMIDHKFVKSQGRRLFNVDLRERFIECYKSHSAWKLANLEFFKILTALRLVALFDLYSRPGLFSLYRNLMLMGPRKTLAQNILHRGAIRSFQDYCIRFLQSKAIL
jgi:aminoglycoside phosphotransferase (APT) family kinase protein